MAVDSTATRQPRDATTQQIGLADLARRALSASELRDLVVRACELVRRVVDCDDAAVLWHAEGRQYGTESAAVDALRGSPYEFASGCVEAVVFADAASETRFDAHRLAASGFHSGVLAALGPDTPPAGVLGAFRRSARLFDAADVAFVRGVASVLGAAAARIRVETELNRARKLQGILCELAQDGIAIIDVMGRISYMNSCMDVLLGGTTGEWVGRDLADVVAEEDRPVIREWLEGEEAEGITQRELRIVRPDGRAILVSTLASPLCDSQRRKVGVVAVFKDTAEREKVRRRDAQFSEVQSIAHLGSWELDLDSGKFRWSDELFRIAGLVPHSRVPTLDLVAEIISTDVHQLLASLEGLAPGDTLEEEHEIVGFDGLRRHVRSRGRRLADDTEHRVIVGTVQDITEEKEAARQEEELRQSLTRAAFEWRMTFDSIPAPILLLDRERTVHRLNAAALRLTQFDDYRGALGQKIEDLGSAAVWAELRRVVQMTIDKSEPIALRTRDASGRHWEVVTGPWTLSGTGRITVFASDVTGIARMQESLERSERMSAMGALVSGVAHEVRNPLFAISATLDAIQATGSPEVPPRFTPALRDQVNRMTELLQDLLEYGRPQVNEFKLGDVGGVVAAARTSVRALAEKSGVDVVLDLATSSARIPMDERRLLQVFENLLRNAVQHSPSGARVEVRAAVRDTAVLVTVTDRGPGFDGEELTRVFEPFFSRRRGGTGLGLSLARRIVEDHGGTIEAANRPDGGALMTVRLPFSQDTSE